MTIKGRIADDVVFLMWPWKAIDNIVINIYSQIHSTDFLTKALSGLFGAIYIYH